MLKRGLPHIGTSMQKRRKTSTVFCRHGYYDEQRRPKRSAEAWEETVCVVMKKLRVQTKEVETNPRASFRSKEYNLALDRLLRYRRILFAENVVLEDELLKKLHLASEHGKHRPELTVDVVNALETRFGSLLRPGTPVYIS